jgi:hypothetical protein
VVTILFDIWRVVGINKEGQGKGERGEMVGGKVSLSKAFAKSLGVLLLNSLISLT